jgi:hypothetical protein
VLRGAAGRIGNRADSGSSDLMIRPLAEIVVSADARAWSVD